MYQIIAYDSPTAKVGTVIFDPKLRKTISGGTLNLSETDIDNLELTVNRTSKLYNNIEPFRTHLEVYQGDKLIFRGRVLKPTRSMAESGTFTQKLSAESVEAYLMDSVQRWGEYHDISVRDFLQVMITTHNKQVPAYKQFKLGEVTVKDSNDSLYRFLGYEKTWDTINDKLIDRLGGYLRVRFESGSLYLDYLANPGKAHQNDNPIILGRNLKSATLDIDPTEVITRLVPLGATIEDEDDEAVEDTTSEVSKPRVTISSVNGGKDYLDIPDLQKEFGVINGSVNWDEVNEPKILLTKAKNWIKNQAAVTESWTISAVELGTGRFIGFDVSDSYLFSNQYLADSQMIRVIAKQIDFAKPHSSTITIGAKKKTLSQYQNSNRKLQNEIAQLKTSNLSLSTSYITLSNNFKNLVNNTTNYQTSTDKEIAELYEKIRELQSGQSGGYYSGLIIDVSEWQGVIDWSKVVAAGLALPIIRVQYGSSHQDYKYAENIQKCLSAGHTNYAVYAYFVGRSTSDAQQEAKDFYSRTQAVVSGKAQPQFYMIDVEESTMTNMRGGVEAYTNQLNNLGVPDSQIVLYIANHLYDNFNLNVERAASVVVPSYGSNNGTVSGSTKPTHPYDLWQYTSTGSVSGISGNVDLNTDPSKRFKENFLNK